MKITQIKKSKNIVYGIDNVPCGATFKWDGDIYLKIKRDSGLATISICGDKTPYLVVTLLEGSLTWFDPRNNTLEMEILNDVELIIKT